MSNEHHPPYPPKKKLLELADRKNFIIRSICVFACACAVTFLWVGGAVFDPENEGRWPFWANIVFFAVCLALIALMNHSRKLAAQQLLLIYCDASAYSKAMMKKDTKKNKVHNLICRVPEYFYSGKFNDCISVTNKICEINTEPISLQATYFYCAFSHMILGNTDECREMLKKASDSKTYENECKFISLYLDEKFTEAYDVLKNCSSLNAAQREMNSNLLREVRVCFLLWLACVKLEDKNNMKRYAEQVSRFDNGTFMKTVILKHD